MISYLWIKKPNASQNNDQEKIYIEGYTKMMFILNHDGSQKITIRLKVHHRDGILYK
jgi:hypothetical protein